MTRNYCPSSYGTVQIVARAVGWMTGVTTLVILAFIINQWSNKGGAVAAGLVGVSLCDIHTGNILAVSSSPLSSSSSHIRASIANFDS
jgi:hypothetical protein